MCQLIHFILEFKWMFKLNAMKFSQDVPEILCSQDWDGPDDAPEKMMCPATNITGLLAQKLQRASCKFLM